MAGETVAEQVSFIAGPPAGRVPTAGTGAQGRIAVDEQRFDRLARTVGDQRTRREAMRWLVGSMAAVVALVRGGSAAAHATVQLGGACYDSSQCRDDGGFGPVYCDDNGYDYDGPLNCCRYEGGYCGENHENCCGQLECWNGGYCTNVSVSPGVGYGLPLGASCTDTSQCNGGGYGVLCVGSFTLPGMTCCLMNGQGCQFDGDCCGSDLCMFQGRQIGSTCAQYYGGQCLSDLGCGRGPSCIRGYCQ